MLVTQKSTFLRTAHIISRHKPMLSRSVVLHSALVFLGLFTNSSLQAQNREMPVRVIAKSDLKKNDLPKNDLLRAESNLHSLTIEQIKEQAKDFEVRGKWNRALELYCHWYSLDRQSPVIRENMQRCLRHVMQQHRLLDKNFQDTVLNLPLNQLLPLYEEVLTKLQTMYVDRQKVSPSRLFQAGVNEFDNALRDPLFRERFLKHCSEETIIKLRGELQTNWSDRTVKDAKEARQLIRSLARLVATQLEMKESPIILEFLCGACNSLDEYTAYLTPGELAEETNIPATTTIHDAEILKDGVAFLRISSFRDSTPAEFDSAIQSLKGQMRGDQLKSIIIDLRGNPGGNFQAAIQIAERFIPSGVLASTIGQVRDANKVFTAGATPNTLDWGLVLLVDQQTASAAEVVASALRENNRAKLIGTHTFGKGSLQIVLQFESVRENEPRLKSVNRTGALRLTLARIFSPTGQPLSVGIAPHIIEADRDQQLNLAIESALHIMPLMNEN